MTTLTVLFRKQPHPAVRVIPEEQPFTACAQHLFPDDNSLAWFELTACMDDGKTDFDGCCSQIPLPAGQLSSIQACINNSTLSGSLVDAMNRNADLNPGQDWPWVLVDGVSMPEPDTHSDDVQPFVSAVCAHFNGSVTMPCCN
jgi:hypothetical protein